MIDFHYKTDYQLVETKSYANWVSEVIRTDNSEVGQIDYIFCDDAYLLSLNQKYLKHDTLTDIITFDYTEGDLVSGDIFISIDRIRENALKYKVDVDDELQRVIIHGILHFCGYKDKTKEDKLLMRKKEDYYLSLRTF